MTLSLLDARDHVQRHFFSSSLAHVNSFTMLGQAPSLVTASLRLLLTAGVRANLSNANANESELKLALESVAQPTVLDFCMKSDRFLAETLLETVQFALRAERTGALCAADLARIGTPLCRIVLRATARTANVALMNELAEFFVARIGRQMQSVMLREAIASAQCKFIKAIIDLSQTSDVRRALIATGLHDALSHSFVNSLALPVESDAREHLIELFASIADVSQVVSLFRLCVAALIAAERSAIERGADAGEAPTRAVDVIKSLCALTSVEAQLACFDDVRKQLAENAREIDVDDQERAITVAMIRCSDAIRAACALEFKLNLFAIRVDANQ
jgi:hypothetical protein